MNQCRSTHPACEFCAGRHLTAHCVNSNSKSKCRNCKGGHAASSSSCPVYLLKYGILKLRYSTGCSKEDAKFILLNTNTDLMSEVLPRGDRSLSDSSGGAGDVPPDSVRGGGGLLALSSLPSQVLSIQSLSDISDFVSDSNLSKKLNEVNKLLNLSQAKLKLLDSCRKNLSP